MHLQPFPRLALGFSYLLAAHVLCKLTPIHLGP